MNKRKFIIGSRESALAVVQSRMVLGYLQEHCPELEVELLTMKTTGDKILDRRLDQIGGKGLFVKELDKALMDRRSDLSVHSMKDLPMEVAEDLPLVGCSRREDPRDVLVLPEGAKEMDFSKPIGTSSLRRSLQLRELFPEARFESIRGNLQTRLRKLDEGQFGAIVLAAAGVKRMGLEHRISGIFPWRRSFLPPARGSWLFRDERERIIPCWQASGIRRRRTLPRRSGPLCGIWTEAVLLPLRPMQGSGEIS